MGALHGTLNLLNDAVPYLQKALENSEEADATLYDHLGDIYSALHESTKAREAWRKAINIEPNEEIQKKLGAAVTSGSGPHSP